MIQTFAYFTQRIKHGRPNGGWRNVRFSWKLLFLAGEDEGQMLCLCFLHPLAHLGAMLPLFFIFKNLVLDQVHGHIIPNCVYLSLINCFMNSNDGSKTRLDLDSALFWR